MESELGDNMDSASTTELSQVKCTEMLRIEPQPQPLGKTLASMFTSEPSLRFQISEAPTWSTESKFPVYNIWSPAFFGIKLQQQPESDEYSLNRNDWIVTKDEDDIESIIKGDSTDSTITFDEENILGSIDVDRPPLFCCACCLQYRGWVRQGDSARWRFDDYSFGQFFRFIRIDKLSNDEEQAFSQADQSPGTILWSRDIRTVREREKIQDQLPFQLDDDARICRVMTGEPPSGGVGRGVVDYQHESWVEHIIAVMNPDGFVFFDNLMHSTDGIDTSDIRELVVLTGLAVAKYDRLDAKKDSEQKLFSVGCF